MRRRQNLTHSQGIAVAAILGRWKRAKEEVQSDLLLIVAEAVPGIAQLPPGLVVDNSGGPRPRFIEWEEQSAEGTAPCTRGPVEGGADPGDEHAPRPAAVSVPGFAQDLP